VFVTANVGVGSFTIVDGHIVTAEDAGNKYVCCYDARLLQRMCLMC